MPRFFISEIPGKQTIISGEDGKHIAKSLRMKVGEPLILCDGQGTDYHCTISAIENEQVTVFMERSSPTTSEPAITVTLYQGLPKSDKMDGVVQKAVELGVTRIVPILSSRCVARPDGKAAQKKLERWQKIAVEAAKQSGRGILPAVCPMVDFTTAIKRATAESTVLFFYEGGGNGLQQIMDNPSTSYSIFIGPEGGFSQDEAAFATEQGAQKATLGPRILRTETAPIAALAAIMLLSGNM